MTLQAYQEKKFKPDTLAIIKQASLILDEYYQAGYNITLRQLYYQFVARGFIENSERSYKRIGSIINDGRMAGLLDWELIEDRTRFMRSKTHWNTPAQIIQATVDNFHVDHWSGQKHYVEVWIEKDALVGIIAPVCMALDVPYFSCRGYTSQSEMWRAAQRFRGNFQSRFNHIIHLGDHDPSGIDMSRDIQDRMRTFGGMVEVKRVALNMDQVERFNPPPNPAKITDSRAREYMVEHGNESWELDALDPKYITDLIDMNIKEFIDFEEWDQSHAYEKECRKKLGKIARDNSG